MTDDYQPGKMYQAVMTNVFCASRIISLDFLLRKNLVTKREISFECLRLIIDLLMEDIAIIFWLEKDNLIFNINKMIALESVLFDREKILENLRKFRKSSFNCNVFAKHLSLFHKK